MPHPESDTSECFLQVQGMAQQGLVPVS